MPWERAWVARAIGNSLKVSVMAIGLSGFAAGRIGYSGDLGLDRLRGAAVGIRPGRVVSLSFSGRGDRDFTLSNGGYQDD
jgi:hypothetical protein